MDHQALLSQLDNIGVEVVTASNRVRREYNGWAVGMSPETKTYLWNRIDAIESGCRNVRELLR